MMKFVANRICCVGDPDLGYVIRDPVPFLPWTRIRDPESGAFFTLDPNPGSGIGLFPDPGSRIPDSRSQISDPGSQISDPGSWISDPGSRIPTPYFS
jgi:hypothetical protein